MNKHLLVVFLFVAGATGFLSAQDQLTTQSYWDMHGENPIAAENLSFCDVGQYSYDQNLDQTINTSLKWSSSLGTTSHLRRFSLEGAYRVVERVSFGVWVADAGTVITINIYGINSGDELTYDNLRLAGTSEYTFDGSESFAIVTTEANGTVNFGEDLVLELVEPNDQFSIGYNSETLFPLTSPNETATSYIAVDQGATLPLGSLDTYGFGHLALIASVCASDNAIPTMSEWGVLILFLSMMILGVLVIKARMQETAPVLIRTTDQ